MKMEVNQEFDQLQLAQLIRFNAHMLDIATRTRKPDLVKKNQEAADLEKYLDLWKKENYTRSSYIAWAEDKLKNYQNWLSDKKLKVKPVREVKPGGNENNLHTAIRERRSIRFWKKKAVPENMIRQILESGTYAPSAFNRLPWRFFIAETPVNELKEGDASNPGMFEQAPVRIFVAVDE